MCGRAMLGLVVCQLYFDCRFCLVYCSSADREAISPFPTVSGLANILGGLSPGACVVGVNRCLASSIASDLGPAPICEIDTHSPPHRTFPANDSLPSRTYLVMKVGSSLVSTTIDVDTNISIGPVTVPYWLSLSPIRSNGDVGTMGGCAAGLAGSRLIAAVLPLPKSIVTNPPDSSVVVGLVSISSLSWSTDVASHRFTLISENVGASFAAGRMSFQVQPIALAMAATSG